MPSLRSFIRSLLRRDIHIGAVAVRPGDDLILSAENWPASEDVVAFLNAAQKQFPGVRIHLLTGVYGVQVHRNKRSGEGEASRDEGRQQPRRTLLEMATSAAHAAPDVAEQGSVVLLRKLTGFGIVAVSVPVSPQQQGNSIKELHSGSAPGDGLTASRMAQIYQLAGDILRDVRPDLFHSDDAARTQRLLARKVRSAVGKFLASKAHKEPSHA